MRAVFRVLWRLVLYVCFAVVLVGLLIIPIGEWVGYPVKPTLRTVTNVAFVPPGERPAGAVPDYTRLRALSFNPDTVAIRNVILVVGDGMGVQPLAAAHALTGQGFSPFHAMPITGLVQTTSASNLVTDSGAGATALATGFKTVNKRLGMTPDGVAVPSILEVLRDQGKAAGIVTTSYLVDATPGGFAAHVRHRDDYEGIAEDLIASGAQVLLGGDAGQFAADLLPKAEAAGYTVVRNEEAFGLVPDSARVLGLWDERDAIESFGPPLPELVPHALKRLSQEPEGFFLLVEQEQIDGAAHGNQIDMLVEAVDELEAALAQILAFAEQDGRTLVVVTADHDTGGLSIEEGAFDESTAEMRWNTFGHTGAWVPLFAAGPGAVAFTGLMDNTDVPRRLARVLDLTGFPVSLEMAEEVSGKR